MTPVLEVSSKPGPLQIKGSGTLRRFPAQAYAARHPDSPHTIAKGAPPADENLKEIIAREALSDGNRNLRSGDKKIADAIL